MAAAVAAGGLAAVVVLAAAPLLLGRGQGNGPVDSPGPVVPSTVYPPLTGEDTIVDEPPGPAAILIAGDHELRGMDFWGGEGRSLLVSQRGSYRLARSAYELSTGIGGGMLLSPDGRYLAGSLTMEGAKEPSPDRVQAAVFDLVAGTMRQYDGGYPMAWSPNGDSILVHTLPATGEVVHPHTFGELRLLSMTTGQARPLPRIEGGLRDGNFAGFSPDGRRLAVATTTALHLIDLVDNSQIKLADLTESDRLAGPGAWLPDGKRIAMYSINGCVRGECDEAALRQRQFHIRYLDADTGQRATGPALAPAQGLAARVLGWQRDGSAVVVVHSPENRFSADVDDPGLETDWAAIGGVELMAFQPGGGRRRLVNLPSSALFVDVPTSLLDRFGAPAPSRLEGTARRTLAFWWPLGQLALYMAILIAAVIGLSLWARRVGQRTTTDPSR